MILRTFSTKIYSEERFLVKIIYSWTQVYKGNSTNYAKHKICNIWFD